MKTTNYIACLFFVLLQSINLAKAQNNDKLHFFIDIPLVEYPYNINTSYQTANMEQSVKLTKSFYYSTHFGLELLGEKKLGKRGKLWSKVLMSVFDFAPFPLSNTWLHEEWHRSVLSLHDIKSKNTHWSGSVKGVDDEDLENLKLLHPADMVREGTSGSEGNLEFVLSVQKDVFLNKVNTWNYGLYWGNYMVNSFYLFGSTRTGSRSLVKFKNSENEDIHKRDANGYDPINATYDLFNPRNPYSDRGIHPSGVGIDRYVEFNDLSSTAQQFLRNQFSLSFLNFLDLNLFGIDELGKNVKYNFSVRHHMTSFGYMVGGNIFLKTKNFGGVISPKLYKNEKKSFFGLDLDLRHKWSMLRLAIWQQPKNQLYRDTQSSTGGLIGIKFTPPLGKVKPYIEMTYKSKGWVAGNPYLQENFSVGLGLSIPFSAH